MDPKFAQTVDELHASFQRLVSNPTIRSWSLREKALRKGVYLFSEGGKNLYVGRSNNIRARYGRHCGPCATHHTATLAFRLAHQERAQVNAICAADAETRSRLMEDAEFANAFAKAKQRVRSMDFRWIEETDPIRQCLLEVYCTVALEAPYNDFDNC